MQQQHSTRLRDQKTWMLSPVGLIIDLTKCTRTKLVHFSISRIHWQPTRATYFRKKVVLRFNYSLHKTTTASHTDFLLPYIWKCQKSHSGAVSCMQTMSLLINQSVLVWDCSTKEQNINSACQQYLISCFHTAHHTCAVWGKGFLQFGFCTL